MKFRLICVMLLIGLQIGCGARFYDQRDFSLGIGEISTFVIDGSSRKRVVRVMGTVTGGEVDVYVYLQENQAEVERLLTLGKGAERMITGVEDSDDIGLVAPIPLEKTAIVMVRNASRNAVQVNLKMSD